jgi:hypothetical protein
MVQQNLLQCVLHNKGDISDKRGRFHSLYHKAATERCIRHNWAACIYFRKTYMLVQIYCIHHSDGENDTQTYPIAPFLLSRVLQSLFNRVPRVGNEMINQSGLLHSQNQKSILGKRSCDSSVVRSLLVQTLKEFSRLPGSSH